MIERLCYFCEEPMEVDFDGAEPVGFHCTPCNHQEPKDLEPLDPRRGEGEIADND